MWTNPDPNPNWSREANTHGLVDLLGMKKVQQLFNRCAIRS